MRKHAFLIWLCIMLAIIVATMLAGSLHAQEYTQVGATFCGKDGQPHIVVDTTEDPADLINTEIHEQVHANALEPNRKPLSVSIREISTLMWEIYGNAWPWYDLVVKFTIIECTDVYRLSGG